MDLPKGYLNVDKLYKDLKTTPEKYWISKGEKRALNLFHKMATRVPAYKDFLAKYAIDHKKIKTITDFKSIPTIDKNNYLRVYSREQLCWDGKFNLKQWTISTTSGSTGEPYYFPREDFQILQYAITAELYLRNNFSIEKKSTLYINAFPMGAWIGGVFTYEAIRLVAKRGNYPLSIISPGINKLEILKSIKNLASNFDQVIIGCYAPFLKDVIDDAKEFGLDWKQYNIGFVFSAEGFTENFRDYVLTKTNTTNVYTSTLNHYGTVDLGTMSHETPLSIMVRRLALETPTLYKELFGDIHKLPTVTQYDPNLFYFEEVDGNLFCSGYSGLPLIRYDLKDRGGVMTLAQLHKTFNTCGLSLDKESKKANIEKTVMNLPFVYVYERSDFSVSFFAFQIYPETIRKAIQKKEFEDLVTGKFTMIVTYDSESNQRLEINIELRHDQKETKYLYNTLQDRIINQLVLENSEYRKTREEFGIKTMPYLIFWDYEDPLYFKPGIKQKWVKQ